ncbi:MAG: RNA polymerase sigma factor [Acidobacteria bacterium]|nr:RNA polymerase sigma factor [Acidobacteriota bacterium]
MSAPAIAVPPVPAAPLSRESGLAAEVKALVAAGTRERARERFGDLVALLQRRAARIAYQYLRDAHDADEAVQDAFLKVFTHISTYREELPFEVWFTRILVNRCLDMQKARARRLRWTLPVPRLGDAPAPEPADPGQTPEQRLLSSERGQRILAAIERLPDRQRLVFTLCQIAEHSTNQVSETLGVSEATVRVHLFRAVRKLRALLEHER